MQTCSHVRVLAMPHPLRICTFRVLYTCGQEFVYPLYISFQLHGMVFPMVFHDFGSKFNLHQNGHCLNGLFMLITMVHVPGLYLIPSPRYLA